MLKKIYNTFFLTIHTVKFLKFEQIYFRIYYKFLFKYKKLKILNKDLSIREKYLHEIKFIDKKITLVKENNLNINNINIKLNYHNKTGLIWNTKDYGKLFSYNINYFDFLNQVNSNTYIHYNQKLIKKWIVVNKNYKNVEYESYVISLRLVNWIIYLLKNNNCDVVILKSILQQANLLSKKIEYNIQANHLIKNAKCLIFVGIFFNNSLSEKFYKIGINLFTDEITKQILNDGAHYERSPMYHLLVLEDILDVINIHKIFNIKHSSFLDKKARAMMNWLFYMSHPDGEISYFNDCNLSTKLNFSKLYNYYKKLNLNNFSLNELANYNIKNLNDSEFSIININQIHLIINRGNINPKYQPGHSHAESLCFELSVYNERLIVNSGISTYNISTKRLKQRSTSSHSTLEIDSTNSSQVWSSFRVAKRARVTNFNFLDKKEFYEVSAIHDGYRVLKGKPIHQRKWVINKTNSEINIYDTIVGNGHHNIKLFYLLHPNIKIIEKNKYNIIYLKTKEKVIHIKIDKIDNLLIKREDYNLDFNLSKTCVKLIAEIKNKQLPLNITTTIKY